MIDEQTPSIPEEEVKDDAQVEETHEEAVETKEPDPAPEDVSEKAKTRKYFQRILEDRNKYREEYEKAQAELAKLKKPTLEEFDHDIEKYQDARLEHFQKSSTSQAAVEKYEQANKEADNVILNAWNGIKHDAVNVYPDFASVFNGEVIVSKEMAEVLVNADNPADVAYYLGKHRDEAARIAALPPHLQGAEMAKIEMKAKPQPRITNAPEPAITRTTGAGQGGKKSYDDMTIDEFMKTRAKERAERAEKMF